jgi:hypothetical protein
VRAPITSPLDAAGGLGQDFFDAARLGHSRIGRTE